MGALNKSHSFLLLVVLSFLSGCGQRKNHSLSAQETFDEMLLSIHDSQWVNQNKDTFQYQGTLVEEKIKNDLPAGVPSSEDKFKNLKESLSDFNPEKTNFEALSTLITLARQEHVSPDQNGIYPYVNSLNTILVNSKPSFQIMLRVEAERLAIPNLISIKNENGQEILPLVLFRGRDLSKELRTKIRNESYLSERKMVDLCRIRRLSEFSAFRKLVDKHLSEVEKIEMPPKEYKTILLVQGYLMGLDPMTELMPEKEYESMKKSETTVVGIGALIFESDKKMKVVTVFPNTGAEAAKLQYGDVITAINGENVNLELKNVDKWRESLKGTEGTDVELLVERKKIGTIKVMVKRAPYTLDELSSKIAHEHFAISMTQFQEETAEKLRKKIDTQKSRSIVLDLRGNPGGFLGTALKAVQTFVKESGVSLIYGKERFGFSDLRDAVVLPLPELEPTRQNVVVLIDNNSASASEILAGSLQDYNRAIVIGDRSFGKGTAQGIVASPIANLPMLKVTTSYYFLGSHRSPQFEGIVPDLIVKRPSSEKVAPGMGGLFMSDLPGALLPIKGKADFKRKEDSKLQTAIQCTKDSEKEIQSQYKVIVDEDLELPDLQMLTAHKAIECMEKAGI